MADQSHGTTDEKLRNLIVSRDKACIRYAVLSIKHYAEALVLDVKHVYQALLSLWFDFTGIACKNKIAESHSSEKENSPEFAGKSIVNSIAISTIHSRQHISVKLPPAVLRSSQDEINAFMAITYRKISAQALYTAIPQLISRIIHDDVSFERLLIFQKR
jgi:hypothetical protein